MTTSLLSGVTTSGSLLHPLQVYLPPCEITLLDSSTFSVWRGVFPEESDVCLYHWYSNPAGSSTEHVSVTLLPSGMIVLSAVSVTLRLPAVWFTKTIKQRNDCCEHVIENVFTFLHNSMKTLIVSMNSLINWLVPWKWTLQSVSLKRGNEEVKKKKTGWRQQNSTESSERLIGGRLIFCDVSFGFLVQHLKQSFFITVRQLLTFHSQHSVFRFCPISKLTLVPALIWHWHLNCHFSCYG